ncbi:hypothetical protein LX32DRAFT_667203 [Colletotrichum zoysiae]|uniref:Uncharacterized protein n=1 Tax=Colletotrichum zoysiae TaxID=1216348 RepID=A0AAD9LWD9_9PEZI|nr:hypothetical protein LX32DRAFT_667203 [Colletotrichum zoysiae]
MSGFGAKVESLLETYSKFLLLLKGLKGTNSSKRPRQLRKSIRSDRSKVRSVYSSRLSISGNILEKGDAAARSSLRKVIKRLSSAMTRLLHIMARERKPVIDYHSLRTLSNSSRIDAVKTIEDLSRRLNAPSLKLISSGSDEKSKRQKRNKLLIKASKHRDNAPSGPKLPQGQDQDEESEKALPIAIDAPSYIQQAYVKERCAGGSWTTQRSTTRLPYSRRTH